MARNLRTGAPEARNRNAARRFVEAAFRRWVGCDAADDGGNPRDAGADAGDPPDDGASGQRRRAGSSAVTRRAFVSAASGPHRGVRRQRGVINAALWALDDFIERPGRNDAVREPTCTGSAVPASSRLSVLSSGAQLTFIDSLALTRGPAHRSAMGARSPPY
jgi:hypothetical protein